MQTGRPHCARSKDYVLAMDEHSLNSDLETILETNTDLWETFRGERLFITGASGFFGCWLLESLLWANKRLGLGTKITALTRNPQTFLQKAPHLAGHSTLTLWPGDVRDFQFPSGNFPFIIHAATETITPKGSASQLDLLNTIIEGTRHTLEFAGHCGANNILFTSSGAVYGRQPPEVSFIPEDFPGGPDPLNSNSAYAEGKRTAELLSTFLSSGTKIARCFAFVGPYMHLDAHFAIGNFIRDGITGSPILIKGDGTPLRSYLYASDLATWLWAILLKGKPGRAYNVGSEEAISIADLANRVANQFTPPPAVLIAQKPTMDKLPERYVPSTQRVREELGLKQQVDLSTAIHKTISWFSSRK